jgi:PAS domain S-box-containing protein
MLAICLCVLVAVAVGWVIARFAKQEIANLIAIACAKTRSGALIASELTDNLFRKIREAAAAVSRKAQKERIRLQDGLRDREKHLARLLASSGDAIVVTDDAHRLLGANQAALDLLGVSRKNIAMFTIDAFLPYGKAHCFDRNVPRFIHGPERCGECQVRRLDGGLRDVEFIFRANFILDRHLSVLHDVTSRLHSAGVLGGSQTAAA